MVKCQRFIIMDAGKVICLNSTSFHGKIFRTTGIEKNFLNKVREKNEILPIASVSVRKGSTLSFLDQQQSKHVGS